MTLSCMFAQRQSNTENSAAVQSTEHAHMTFSAHHMHVFFLIRLLQEDPEHDTTSVRMYSFLNSHQIARTSMSLLPKVCLRFVNAASVLRFLY